MCRMTTHDAGRLGPPHRSAVNLHDCTYGYVLSYPITPSHVLLLAESESVRIAAHLEDASAAEASKAGPHVSCGVSWYARTALASTRRLRCRRWLPRRRPLRCLPPRSLCASFSSLLGKGASLPC